MKSKSEKIQKIFDSSSKEDLIRFLQKEFSMSTPLRERFLRHFSDHLQADNEDSYRDQLHALNQSHLSLGKDPVLVSVPKLSPWLEIAEKQILEGHYGEALHLIRSMIDVYGKIDGSSDPVREAMIEVMNVCTRALFDLFRQCQVPHVKEEILQFAYRAVQENKYPFWHLELCMFDFLLAQEWSNDYRQSLKTISFDRLSEADTDSIKAKYVIMFCKSCEPSEIELIRSILNRYRHLPLVNQFHFLWAHENRYWKEAAEVAEEGLHLALESNNLPGVIKWQRDLLNIAEVKDDIQRQKKYAYQLYLSQENHDREIYSKLKHLHVKDWTLFRDRLLKDLVSENPHNILKRAEIYHTEDLNAELLSLLETYPYLLDQFSRHLWKMYPEQILEIYRVFLENLLSNNSGRKTYRQFCYALADITENIPGGRDFSEGMIIRMRLEYKHRKAFIDELNKITENYGFFIA